MLDLRLFGGASIQVGHGALTGGAGQTRRLALLVLLATAPTGAISREKLIAYLWPRADAEQGRHLLSVSLHVLRKAVGVGTILSEGDVIRLDPDLASCDVVEFESALKRGDLQRAVSLYTAPFLDGFFLRDAPEFESWVEAERLRLSDCYATALEQLAAAAETGAEHLNAVACWKRLVAHDPYNSRYALRLMRALVAAGDPANALKQAEEHAGVLDRELGVQPPGELLAFAEQLKQALIGPESAPGSPDSTRAAVGAVPGQAGTASAQPAVAEDVERRPRLLTWRRIAVAFVGAMSIWGVILAIRVILPRQAESPVLGDLSLDPTHRIAVVSFTYRGSDEFAYLGEAMIDLLSTTLDGVGGLHAVDPRAVAGVAAQEARGVVDPVQARLIAERLGAGRYVLGEVVEVSRELRIAARLYTLDQQSTDAVTAIVQGDPSEFYVLVDDLTRQLAVGAVGQLSEYDRLAARTTDSLSALKIYLGGIAEHRAGRFSSAFAAFRRAVEIDSTFALAWYGMAFAGTWPGMMEWDVAMYASERAVRHSERLPPRVQGLLKAFAAIMHGNGPEAESHSRQVLSRYSDDVEAWWALAWTLSHLSPFYGRPISGEVGEAIGRAYQYDPHDPDNQIGAAYWAVRVGDWVGLHALLKAEGLGWWMTGRAVHAFGSGDESALNEIMSREQQAGRAFLLNAGLFLAYARKDVAAGAELARLAVLDSLSQEERVLARVRLAQIELAVGRWRAAETALASVAGIKPTWATLYRSLWAVSPYPAASEADLRALRDSISSWIPGAGRPSVTHTGARALDILAPQLRLYVLGRLSQRLGDRVTALGYAAELEEIGNPPGALSFAVDRAQSVRAHVLYDRGALEEALQVLRAQPRRMRIGWLFIAPFYSSPEDRFLWGEILTRLERYDEALLWYETIGDPGPGDIHFVAPAHLRRAEIYERLGERENAALYYKKFIDAWRDCDPELRPLVERANRALERLITESAVP